MGVKIREIQPGLTGTHLHFHDVEEEWAYVLSGQGSVRIGPLTLPVCGGDFVGFPPGPRPHHFIATGHEPLVLLEGGERRRDEDYCTYPELGIRCRNGEDEPIDRAGLPTFEGESHQLVHLDDVEEHARPHPLTPEAIRHQRGLDEATGLQRQACAWVRIESGVESTTFHSHEHTDEWVYILSGDADVRLDGETYRVSAGDFIAHPAKGPTHVMRAITSVTYLMGGQHIADDIVTYPERGMRLTAAGFEKIMS
jgi:uncharacterized cupin superfamily protein